MLRNTIEISRSAWADSEMVRSVLPPAPPTGTNVSPPTPANALLRPPPLAYNQNPPAPSSIARPDEKSEGPGPSSASASVNVADASGSSNHGEERLREEPAFSHQPSMGKKPKVTSITHSMVLNAKLVSDVRSMLLCQKSFFIDAQCPASAKFLLSRGVLRAARPSPLSELHSLQLICRRVMLLM